MKLLSYERVYKVEHKIYSFQNIKLWRPVSIKEFGYFVLFLSLAFVFSKWIPAFSKVPFLIKYVLIPAGLTTYFRDKKLDGKAPPRYFIDYMRFLAMRNNRIRFFKSIKKPKQKKVRLRWNCTARI